MLEEGLVLRTKKPIYERECVFKGRGGLTQTTARVKSIYLKLISCLSAKRKPMQNRRKGVTVVRFVAADPEKCTGCDVCELGCALEKEKLFNPHVSRIRTMHLSRLINLHACINLVVTCRLCENAPCVVACPRDALRQSKETGVILVNEDKCNGCGWCIQACPYGAIMPHPEKNVVMMCDLCDGQPKCVDWCPEDALNLVTQEEFNQKVRATTAHLMKSGSRVIVFDATACYACGICELACSLYKEGKCGSSLSRIKLKRDPFVGEFTVEFLEQCDLCREREKGPICVETCPWNALKYAYANEK